jgi:hypothetical protein
VSRKQNQLRRALEQIESCRRSPARLGKNRGNALAICIARSF